MAGLAELVLAVMLRAPASWDAQEAITERSERLAVIAQAAVETTRDPELLALMLATSYEEGQRWDRLVHEGKVRGDGGKAACLNQLHAHGVLFPRAEWKASMGLGLEPTRVCMGGGARMLFFSMERCGGRSLEDRYIRAITLYGTGTTCRAGKRPWPYRRARLAMRWLKELLQP